MLESKKASIIMILNVLREYSDENHYLTQKEIIEKVNSIYGISLERKSVAYSISLLEELDYDIIRNPKGGVALFSREIDESEVKFLVDGIYSSKSLSGSQAKNLANKISSFLSKYQRKNYDYLLTSGEVTRTDNRQVFLNIEIINEAIAKKKWVGFKYQGYDENGEPCNRFEDYIFHASPCYLINNFGKYYLLAWRPKYDAVNMWRVDKMVDMYVMEERDMKDPKTLKEFAPYSSISEYLNDHIYLFDGEVVTSRIVLKDESAISYVKEWFGKQASVKKEGNKNVSSSKQRFNNGSADAENNRFYNSSCSDGIASACLQRGGHDGCGQIRWKYFSCGCGRNLNACQSQRKSFYRNIHGRRCGCRKIYRCRRRRFCP